MCQVRMLSADFGGIRRNIIIIVVVVPNTMAVTSTLGGVIDQFYTNKPLNLNPIFIHI
jgi:hypothetical protein